MVSISGGVINTTFTEACSRVGEAEPGECQGQHDVGQRPEHRYTSYNKPATITRGTNAVSFDHDPEHRTTQFRPDGMALRDRRRRWNAFLRWRPQLGRPRGDE